MSVESRRDEARGMLGHSTCSRNAIELFEFDGRECSWPGAVELKRRCYFGGMRCLLRRLGEEVRDRVRSGDCTRCCPAIRFANGLQFLSGVVFGA